MDESIASLVLGEVESFARDTIRVAQDAQVERNQLLSRKNLNYDFSQIKLLNLIDLYSNSRFETGQIDSEGQRKLFLNIINFFIDVARKNTDLDVKDFQFLPENTSSTWKTYCFQKQFQQFAKEQGFGQLINDLNRDRIKYGSCIVKRIGKDIVRVPLSKIKITQDALSIKDAAEGGGFFIEEHEMTWPELKKMELWDTENIPQYKGRKTIYERYGLIKETLLGNGGDDFVLSMVIVAPAIGNFKNTDGVLFKEKIISVPYEESHWERIDGRWLGIGESEKQIENQVARNTIVNMRRRSLLWSSKKLFQSTDQNLARNLIRDVKDGDILTVGPNGQIQEVPVASQALAEFQSFDMAWSENSQQKAFAFEVATGQALPSGTPFRLGAILSGSVATYYDLKREEFGFFLKNVVFNQMIPIFKRQSGDTFIALFGNEEGIDVLKNKYIEREKNRIAKEFLLRGSIPNVDEISAFIESQMKDEKYLYLEIPKGYYDDMEYSIRLNITGEDIDTNTKLTTYTTIYQLLSQRGDQRADIILEKILSMSGEALPRGGQPGSIQQTAQQQTSPQPASALSV